MKFLRVFLVFFCVSSLTLLPSCDENEENEEVADEVCDNGIDDDMDGDIDCADSDCFSFGLCGPSDRRVKEDIEYMSYGLSTIMALETYSFKYIESEGQHLGLMAQDVQKLLPEIVIDDPASEEDIMAIRYQELIPVLINAIQEQQVMIEELKAMNAELSVSE